MTKPLARSDRAGKQQPAASGNAGSRAGARGQPRRPSVWLVNHYATLPSKDGQEGRHLALARHLEECGWDASVIAAATTHPAGSRTIPWWRLRKSGTESGVPYVLVGASGYKTNGLRRIANMVTFTGCALLPTQTGSLPRPDIVVGSTVHPFAAWAGMKLAGRTGAAFVLEIRDVWPETLVDFGHWKNDGWPTRATTRLMRRLIKQASLVVAPLPAVDLYLQDMGEPNKEFLWVANGVEAQQDLPSIRTPSSPPFVFMYLGAHGNANVLDRIIDGFNLFVRQNPDADAILELIGDGPLKPTLVDQAARTPAAARIRFSDRIPRSQVLNKAATAHCLIAATGSYAVYRYGIGLNKLQDYLLSGRPVIFASNAEINPVQAAVAGIAMRSTTPESLAGAMTKMIKTDAEGREQFGANGRRYVLENCTYQRLAWRLSGGLEAVLARQQGRPAVVERAIVES